jgi:hypothetical protein
LVDITACLGAVENVVVVVVVVAEHRGLLSAVSMVMCVDMTAQVLLNPGVTARAIWQAVRRLG